MNCFYGILEKELIAVWTRKWQQCDNRAHYRAPKYQQPKNTFHLSELTSARYTRSKLDIRWRSLHIFACIDAKRRLPSLAAQCGYKFCLYFDMRENSIMVDLVSTVIPVPMSSDKAKSIRRLRVLRTPRNFCTLDHRQAVVTS